jgi:hypothetical protein
MRLVMAKGGFRHLAAASAAGHTLCGRDCSSWEDAPEHTMRDVPAHEYCVACWSAVRRSRDDFRDETWSDGSSVYPLDFGRGGYIPPDEVRRIRAAHGELLARERERMQRAHAS